MSEQTYLKTPFVWEEPKPTVEIPSRLKFQPVKDLDDQELISTVAQVMETSIDASDRKEVLKHGAYHAAELFLNASRDDFFYENEWWQLAYNDKQKIVGFVLPVIYQNCAKNGLEEGTIYYIGVLPEFRGNGFSKDLLLKGTRILQNIGVWRVFCDTDVQNRPMISAFEQVGYKQYSQPCQRPL